MFGDEQVIRDLRENKNTESIFLNMLIGWLLGGPVSIGTLICAFAAGPILQFAFSTVRFDSTTVRHQRLKESVKVMSSR